MGTYGAVELSPKYDEDRKDQELELNTDQPAGFGVDILVGLNGAISGSSYRKWKKLSYKMAEDDAEALQKKEAGEDPEGASKKRQTDLYKNLQKRSMQNSLMFMSMGLGVFWKARYTNGKELALLTELGFAWKTPQARKSPLQYLSVQMNYKDSNHGHVSNKKARSTSVVPKRFDETGSEFNYASWGSTLNNRVQGETSVNLYTATPFSAKAMHYGTVEPRFGVVLGDFEWSSTWPMQLASSWGWASKWSIAPTRHWSGLKTYLNLPFLTDCVAQRQARDKLVDARVGYLDEEEMLLEAARLLREEFPEPWLMFRREAIKQCEMDLEGLKKRWFEAKSKVASLATENEKADVVRLHKAEANELKKAINKYKDEKTQVRELLKVIKFHFRMKNMRDEVVNRLAAKATISELRKEIVKIEVQGNQEALMSLKSMRTDLLAKFSEADKEAIKEVEERDRVAKEIKEEADKALKAAKEDFQIQEQVESGEKGPKEDHDAAAFTELLKVAYVLNKAFRSLKIKVDKANQEQQQEDLQDLNQATSSFSLCLKRGEGEGRGRWGGSLRRNQRELLSKWGEPKGQNRRPCSSGRKAGEGPRIGRKEGGIADQGSCVGACLPQERGLFSIVHSLV